jgi:hypothetical protein
LTTKDELAQLAGTPETGDLKAQVDAAPDEPPPFGEGEFVDAIVWVKTDFYTGLGYSDDEGIEPIGDASGEDETDYDKWDRRAAWKTYMDSTDDDDEPNFPECDAFYVYPEPSKVLVGGHYILRRNQMRLATKQEVRSWFAMREREL